MKQATGNNPNLPYSGTSIQLNLGGFSVILPSQKQVSTFNFSQLGTLNLTPSTPLNAIWNTASATLVPSHLFNPNIASDLLAAAGFNLSNSTTLYCTLPNNITLLWAAENSLLSNVLTLNANACQGHPLELILQNTLHATKTIVLIDNAVAHIASFADGQLVGVLSSAVTSPIDVLYFIAQMADIEAQLEVYGDVTADVKALVNKRFRNSKFFTQQHYSLTHFHKY